MKKTMPPGAVGPLPSAREPHMPEPDEAALAEAMKEPEFKRFVEAHFALPAEAGAAPPPASQGSIVTHIDGLWDLLTRSTPSAP